MSRRADERRERDAELDETDVNLEPLRSEDRAQSGDTQALPPDSEASDESVRELAEDGQPYEADVIEGVERAGNNPERPVHSHQDQRPVREDSLPSDPDWK